MTYYKNKTVWITGASSGIGKEMAIQLSGMGASLILSSRKKSSLEEVARLCKSTTVNLLPLDLEDHDNLDKILSDNKSLISTVDILINNGGISQRSKVIETSFEVYKRLMDINYFGTIKLSKGILPYFLGRNSGHFVVVSSMAGKFGVPVRSGYSASKMALHGFFDALRAELASTNINTTIICPGYIKTDISKNALTSDGSPQGTMDEAQRNGMAVDTMVKKVLQAVASGKAEYHVGRFKEVKMAGLVARLMPNLLRKIIAKSKVT